jgi:Flp pilus assembly protein TadG
MMPIMMLLLVGALALARVAYAAIEVSNAAKAAVQYGASSGGASGDKPGMLNAAQADAADLQTTAAGGTSLISFPVDPVVTGICSDGSACIYGVGGACGNKDCSTSQIENILTVTTQVTISSPFVLPGVLPSTYTLNGRAQQKVANQ